MAIDAQPAGDFSCDRAIDIVRINLDDPLKAEFDENDCRKAFTMTERAAIAKAIEEREAERMRLKQQEAGKKFGKGKVLIASENVSEGVVFQERAKDVAAKAVGMSRPTLKKAQAVVKFAEENPGHPLLDGVLEEMDHRPFAFRVYGATVVPSFLV